MDWWYQRQGERCWWREIGEGGQNIKQTNIKISIVDFSAELSLPYPGLTWLPEFSSSSGIML